MRAYSPVSAVLRGERPEEPLEAESLGFSNALWRLVQSCWSESSSTRPDARQLFEHLSIASLTWVPPRVYPVAKITPQPQIRYIFPFDSGLSSSSTILLTGSECEV